MNKHKRTSKGVIRPWYRRRLKKRAAARLEGGGHDGGHGEGSAAARGAPGVSAEKVLAQIAHLEAFLEHGTGRPWWNSHGEPYAGDKAAWDTWERWDPDTEDEPYVDVNTDVAGAILGDFRALFYGDVVDQHDTDTLVGAVNNLASLLELKRAAVEWAVALHEIHKKTFEGPGPHTELEGFQEREHRLAELALVVLEEVG